MIRLLGGLISLPLIVSWCNGNTADFDSVIIGSSPVETTKILIDMKASEIQQGGEHYKKYAIQPTDFIHRNGVGFIEGNVIKYVLRHRDKNGKQDLLKAKHYIDLLLEYEYATDYERT